MKSYKITNMSTLSIVIEDMGVSLPGPLATVTVTEDVLNRSKLLHTLSRFLKIEEVIKTTPVWPFVTGKPARITTVSSKSPPPSIPKRPAPTKASPDSKPVNVGPAPVSSSVEKAVQSAPATTNSSALEKQVEVLSGKLDSLVDLLMKNASSPAVFAVNPGPDAPISKTTSFEEPIFIPSTMVPTTKDSNLNVKQEEIKTADLTDAVATLKRMRGKK